MCGRFPALTLQEVREVVASLEEDAPLARLPDWPLGTWPQAREQKYPGSQVHVIMPDYSCDRSAKDGFLELPASELAASALKSYRLDLRPLTWGIDAPWQQGKLIFNARVESVLRDVGRKAGMWAHALEGNRCLVAAAGFYEPHATERVVSRRTGKAIKRAYAFASAAGTPLLMAGLVLQNAFAIVTTEPNATVSPVHDRMPLVLTPDEVGLWLHGASDDVARLANRAAIELAVAPEDADAQLVDEASVRGSSARAQGAVSRANASAGASQSGAAESEQLSLF